jgi:serine O-acetyltransferase
MVRIGKNCNLSHSVTIGYKQRGSRQGAPVIGDRVYIGPNSVLVGDIHIGNDVAIGAGSIVVKSVPDRAVVAGNPAQILSYAGSFEMVTYDHMERDPARIESLAASKIKPEPGTE